MFEHEAPHPYSGSFGRFSIVQPSTVLERSNYSPGLLAGIVLSVYYPDEIDNISAVRSVGDLSIIQEAGRELQKIAENDSLYTQLLGYRVECDVLAMYADSSEILGFVLKNVPCPQRGGVHDYELWTPKGCTNWDGSSVVEDFFNLDGDVVLVGFLGNSFPYGALILDWVSHKLNRVDPPRDLHGYFGHQKEFGDKIRKDGKVFIQKYNGVYRKVDRTGNLIIDTVQAGKKVFVDRETGQVVEEQDQVDWGAASGGEIASPGGGDIDVRVKNNRQLSLKFADNQTKIDRNVHPPDFKETGSVQVTNDGDNNRIEINLNNSVSIKVNKGSADGKFYIETEDTKATITMVDGKIQFSAENGNVTLDLQNSNFEVNAAQNINATATLEATLTGTVKATVAGGTVQLSSGGPILLSGTGIQMSTPSGTDLMSMDEDRIELDSNEIQLGENSNEIQLGDKVEQLATKSWVESVFAQHIHTSLPAGGNTSLPIYLPTGSFIIGPVKSDGTIDAVPGVKIATSKTKAE